MTLLKILRRVIAGNDILRHNYREKSDAQPFHVRLTQKSNNDNYTFRNMEIDSLIVPWPSSLIPAILLFALGSLYWIQRPASLVFLTCSSQHKCRALILPGHAVIAISTRGLYCVSLARGPAGSANRASRVIHSYRMSWRAKFDCVAEFPSAA